MKKRLLSRLLPLKRDFVRDMAKTLLIFLGVTAINLFMVQTTGDTKNVSELYILAVLLISLHTTGYFWGLLGAVAGVIGTNYLFTYPYYAFNFSLRGYPVTFLSMLVAAGIVGTLAANIKEQRNLSRIREENTQKLNLVAQQLLSAQSAEQIAQMAAQWLRQLFSSPCLFLLSPEADPYFSAKVGESVPPPDRSAMSALFSSRLAFFSGSRPLRDSWVYYPVFAGDHVLAVAGICLGKEGLPENHQEFLPLLLSQFAMALERQRLADEQQQMAVKTQMEQTRANLLRAISHDLRTPLTGILGASSAILENSAHISPQDLQKLVRDVHEDADWLLRMVENVLSVTRVSPGASSLRKVPEAVEEVVAQAINRCRARLTGLSLTVQVPDEFIMAPMDSTLIEQVLINLIENAYKYGHSPQPIQVMVLAEKGSVRFVVRDHGSGISPSLLPQIFEEFAAKSSQSPDSGRGLGIGLSICRSIITAHGGTIHAENPPDGGACFTFTLPLEEENDHAHLSDPDHRG